MGSRIVYFEHRKPENTRTAFELVKERLTNSAVTRLVIASTTGDTARKASEFYKDAKVCFEIVLMVTDAGLAASGGNRDRHGRNRPGGGHRPGNAGLIFTTPQKTSGP